MLLSKERKGEGVGMEKGDAWEAYGSQGLKVVCKGFAGVVCRARASSGAAGTFKGRTAWDTKTEYVA